MINRLKNFLLKNTSNKQTVAKNTIWLTVGEIGSRLLKLFVFAHAARVLGVNEWGIFSYGLALIGIFSILSDVGVNSILLREVAKKTKDIGTYISTGFFIKITLSFISALLLLGTTLFIDNEAIKSLLPFITIVLFIDSTREFGFALNRASEKMETEAIVKLLTNALLLVTAIITIKQSPTAISLTVAYIVSGVLSLILLSYILRKYFSDLTFSFNTPFIKKMFIEAWPVGVVAIYGTILSSIDTIILGWIRPATEVGYYAAAQKPLQLLWLVPGLLGTALLPTLSRIATQDTQKFSSVLSRTISAAIAVMVPMVLICILFANFIIVLLFGINFAPAAPLLQISAIGALAIIPSIFISNALLAYGKQKLTIRFIALGALSNIVISFLLIPYYGMYGAAISYTLSQIISNVFIVQQTKNIPGFKIIPSGKLLLTDVRNIFNR